MMSLTSVTIQNEIHTSTTHTNPNNSPSKLRRNLPQQPIINPDTNKPYTGNLDVINNDWGKDTVEFNKDYVDGLLHGAEKSYYQYC